MKYIFDDIVSLMVIVLCAASGVSNLYYGDYESSFIWFFFGLYVIGSVIRVCKLKSINDKLNKL